MQKLWNTFGFLLLPLLIVSLLLLAVLAASYARAEQVVALCTQLPGGTVANCVPVSSTHPLPIYYPLGH